jgi:hypothetical protein
LVGYARECGIDISDAREVLTDPVRHSGLHRQVTEALVHLVAIVALAYEPRSVLVTGGFSRGLDDALLQRVSGEVAGIVGVPINLRRTSLGDHAGLYGALASALDALYRVLGVQPEHLDAIEVDRVMVTDLFDRAPDDQREES